jgi:uncharacterized membrane protein (DUF4010 family)
MPTDRFQLFYGLAIALAGGLLVGLERGWHQRARDEGERIAGIRTFALIGLFGGICGLLGSELGGIVLAAGILAAAGLLAVGYRQSVQVHHRIGTTTAVAGLVVFGLGATAVRGYPAVAAAMAVVTTLLLSIKPALHRWLELIEPRELQTAIQFLLIAVVVLPLLPNVGYGPSGAFNLYQVGWAVVLISGLSFAGYIAVKLAGPERGILLVGLFGGLASSTATTITLARMAKADAPVLKVLAAGIAFACSVMLVRIMILLAIVYTPLILSLWVPLGLMALTTAVAGWWLWHSNAAPVALNEELRNPAEFGQAMRFGALLAVILLLAGILKDRLGSLGVFALAGVSGLADTDAITISISKLSADQTLSEGTAIVAVLIAASANVIMKGLLVHGLAGGVLARWITLVFGATIAAGVAGYALLQAI